MARPSYGGRPKKPERKKVMRRPPPPPLGNQRALGNEGGRPTEVDALVRQGLLKQETRNDLRAIRAALYGFLDSTLGAMP